MLFEESALITFHYNSANDNDGVLYAWNNCTIISKGNSKANFNDSKALGDGGALYMNNNNNPLLLFQGISIIN